ncbi:MAG: membrane protein insertase YidC [Candidatus Omnitrophota bacterium]|nr:membrane protein insertase YidC [Candidatus Omnitrophota bacterium]
MEKKLILAIAFSVLIIVGFQYLFPSPKQAPMPGKTQEAAVVKEKEVENIQYLTPTPPADEKEFLASTDRYIVTFSNIGGAIKKIELRNYKKLKSNDPMPLVEEKTPSNYLFSINDTLGALPLNQMAYKLDSDDNKIIYTLAIKNLEIVKIYTLRNSSNVIELQLLVKNYSSSPAELGYKIISGSGLVEPRTEDKNLIEVISKVDGKTVGFKRPNKNVIVNPGIVSWVAAKTRYFSLIMKPYGQTKSQYHGYAAGDKIYSGIEMEKLLIPANSSVENKFVLYAGPSIGAELKKLGLEFEESINYGFFGGIAKLLLVITAFFYKLVHNWGLSIILISIFLNIVLFPLTLKSFQSMQKMHELHPQMEKLKAQNKDNPQKLNKEVLELYKKYKINPLSGCLPLLLQMPIFVALYQALTKSIDLRGASFLWISDLSMPDAVGIPFSLPIFGNSINVLPLMMVALMVVQQKISSKVMGGAVTEEQRQQQKIMLVIMPIMFGFIFYNMPSGMVLYWVVNTVLTIVEQSVILKKT